MPPEDQNVAGTDLFRKTRYHATEQWFGPDGDPFPPQTVHAIGGNTKIWGGVLERMREKEFSGLTLQEGPTSAWGLNYADLAPWYDKAEALYNVHGVAGADPTAPPREGDYPAPPRPVEPFLVELGEALERQRLHPYDLPLSWSDGAKATRGDAEMFGVEPARNSGVTVREGARVVQLHVNPSGHAVRGVEAEIGGQRWLFRSHQVVLAAGAVTTAEILLRSATDHHLRGLANGSDQVGRNLMRPQLEDRLTQACVEGLAGKQPTLASQLERPCRQLAAPTSRCLVQETDASGKGLAVLKELLQRELGPEGERIVKRCVARQLGLPASSLDGLSLRELTQRAGSSRP